MSQYDVHMERSALGTRSQWCQAAMGATRRHHFGCDGTRWVAQVQGLQDVARAECAAPRDDLGKLRRLVDFRFD